VKEISLHILDIAENSVKAGADMISISLSENLKKDTLDIIIADNGKGMNADAIKTITDPFTTSRTTRRVGLGIPFLKAAAEACNGFLFIKSESGEGTTLHAQFQHSHIDRMPIGNLQATLMQLLIGYPKIHWIFNISRDDNSFLLDDKEIKGAIGDLSLSHPQVLKAVKQIIQTGLDDLHQ